MDWDKQELMQLYTTMVKIRFFEEKVEELFLRGEIPGFVHLYIGEEAVAAGVSQHLRKDDYITSNHRGHGHTIAKGADLNRMMAEIYGKRTGTCKGKGGSMHIADFSVGMLGANGVVGGGLPIAVGSGLSAKIRKTGQVTVAYFGDGASNRGTFHEAANMAAAWKLPVIFVCENNRYASTTPHGACIPVENIADRAAGYAMPGVIVNGNDVFEVCRAAGEAVALARSGGGPTLIEAKTYRIKGHFVGDPELYRSKEEVNKMKEKDPIIHFEQKVLAEKWLTPEEMQAVRERAEELVKEAVAFAVDSPYPEPEEALQDLFKAGEVTKKCEI